MCPGKLVHKNGCEKSRLDNYASPKIYLKPYRRLVRNTLRGNLDISILPVFYSWAAHYPQTFRCRKTTILRYLGYLLARELNPGKTCLSLQYGQSTFPETISEIGAVYSPWHSGQVHFTEKLLLGSTLSADLSLQEDDNSAILKSTLIFVDRVKTIFLNTPA